MIRLETERLVIRNYKVEDVEKVYVIFSNEDVARYEDFHPMSLDEVTDMIQKWITYENRFVVISKDSGDIIGTVGYWIDEVNDYSLDYDFNPRYGKSGYATEAAQRIMDYIFIEKQVPHIYADCDTNNIDSFRLMERIGMKRIQTIKNQSYKSDKDGNPIMINIYVYKKDKQ